VRDDTESNNIIEKHPRLMQETNLNESLSEKYDEFSSDSSDIDESSSSNKSLSPEEIEKKKIMNTMPPLTINI